MAESTHACGGALEGRVKVQTSVTVCGVVALPETTWLERWSIVTSISVKRIATVA